MRKLIYVKVPVSLSNRFNTCSNFGTTTQLIVFVNAVQLDTIVKLLLVMVGLFKWENVLHVGLLKVGFASQSNVSTATKLKRFQSHYGCSPTVVSQMLHDMQRTVVPEARLDDNEIDIVYFLMSLYFLRCYPTANQIEALFNVSAVTSRKWIWFYVKKIQCMTKEKVT